MMNREPVAIAAAVRAVLLAAMAFGWHLSAEQVAAVAIAVEAVSALFVRSKVYASGNVIDVESPEQAFDLLTGGGDADRSQ